MILRTIFIFSVMVVLSTCHHKNENREHKPDYGQKVLSQGETHTSTGNSFLQPHILFHTIDIEVVLSGILPFTS
ncbi:hypothetical protein BX666DRAFT_2002595 [Dichotomocladium elegans]|nr:hypothetical protein BX666DRAFT_2002595 [Dichotomocladium elegans]